MNFDLLVDTNIGRIQIEVNSNHNNVDYVRNTAYICNTYSKYTNRGERYNELVMIIQINMTYGMKDSEYIREYQIKDNEGKVFVNNFKIIELNMDKIKNLWYTDDIQKRNKYKYLIMLDLNKKELESFNEIDKVVSKYMEEINKINENPDFIHYISREEDMKKRYKSILYNEVQEATAKGIEQGIEQGSKENSIMIAKKLKEENIPLEIISKSTGLTAEEISNL